MPGRNDRTDAGLQVDGVLPEGLSGRYVWIENEGGSTRACSLVLHAGMATSYRQKLISTHTARGAPTTNLIVFAGRILTLADGCLAQELTPDLETSPVDIAGHDLGIGAHPKIDPLTGELHLISSPGEINAQHHVISAGGMTRRTHPVTGAPAPVLDLAITPNHLIMFANGFTGVTDHSCDQDLVWLPTRPTRSGHIINAHDINDGAVVVHLIGQGLEEWTLTAAAGIIRRRVLDRTPQEPSRFNERFTGSAHRYLYAVGHDGRGTGTYMTLLKQDLHASTCESRPFSGSQHPGEFLFVGDPHRPDDEDGGWLLGTVHDHAPDRSVLQVIEATDFAGAVVASIHLPRRCAHSVRGLWVASDPSRAPETTPARRTTSSAQTEGIEQ